MDENFPRNSQPKSNGLNSHGMCGLVIWLKIIRNIYINNWTWVLTLNMIIYWSIDYVILDY